MSYDDGGLALDLPLTGRLVLAGACAFLTVGVLTASALAGVLMAVDRALDARRRKAGQ